MERTQSFVCKGSKGGARCKSQSPNVQPWRVHYSQHGTFWVTDAVASQGEIEEECARCWDAMEIDKGVLCALKTFPISTEAWSMLGDKA